MHDISEIIRRLAESQKESGISYAVLEKKTGIGHSTIQRYLTGISKKVPLNDLVKICEALSVDPAEIMGWSGSESSTDADRLEALHQNPRLGMLFDHSRKMKPDDVEFMIEMAERILKERDSQ